MSFGVLFDFTGNSNVSKVITATTLVKEQWFLDAVNYDKPIDLFLLIGHNPVRTDSPTFTMEFVSRTIRALRPEVPLQVFGGHTHIRDFRVYDDMSTALEAGESSPPQSSVARRNSPDDLQVDTAKLSAGSQ
jgi:hypothetical protein